MGSTYQRSFVKGVLWEFFSFIIAIAVAYIYYGNLGDSFRFAFFLTIIKIPFFFIHERIWKSVSWGKIKDNK